MVDAFNVFKTLEKTAPDEILDPAVELVVDEKPLKPPKPLNILSAGAELTCQTKHQQFLIGAKNMCFEPHKIDSAVSAGF